MQADPMKPTLKPPGTDRLKLKCDSLLSTSAFKFNLRRYTQVYNVIKGEVRAGEAAAAVGRCKLTL